MKKSASYQITKGEVGEIKDNQEVEQLQNELEKILPKLRKLKEFSFTNAAKNCDITTIDFLKGCKNLETVWIYHCDITDYAVLKSCPKLKEIKLAGSKKEMRRLYEAFPDVKITAGQN